MEDPRIESRKRGLISGAIRRGELPALGTLVRWNTKGEPAAGRFRVDKHRLLGDGQFRMHITSIKPSARNARGTAFHCWVAPEQVIVVGDDDA